MYQISNFTENDDVKILSELGAFQIIEYQRDLSVSPQTAVTAFFSAQMNIRKRQLVCDLSKANVTIQAGSMQWMLGNVNATTGIKGVGDFLGKAVRGKASGESAIKPEYTGNGILVLEPTYKYLILMDAADWGGGVVLDDGLFLACESSLQHKAVMRSNFSSAVAGGEGLFNLSLNGNGVFCIAASRSFLRESGSLFFCLPYCPIKISAMGESAGRIRVLLVPVKDAFAASKALVKA